MWSMPAAMKVLYTVTKFNDIQNSSRSSWSGEKIIWIFGACRLKFVVAMNLSYY